MVSIDRCEPLREELIFHIAYLTVRCLDLVELLVPRRLRRRTNCSVRVAIMPVVVEKSLADVFECSGIICLLGGFVKHGVIF